MGTSDLETGWLMYSVECRENPLIKFRAAFHHDILKEVYILIVNHETREVDYLESKGEFMDLILDISREKLRDRDDCIEDFY